MMFLAQTVFHCTLSEAFERMPGWELAYWIAHYSREPWGNEWLQTGTVSSLIANANRDPKKRKKPYKPEDFMPKVNLDGSKGRRLVRKPVQTPQQMLAVLKQIPGTKTVGPDGGPKRIATKPRQTPEEMMQVLQFPQDETQPEE